MDRPCLRFKYQSISYYRFHDAYLSMDIAAGWALLRYPFSLPGRLVDPERESEHV